MMHAARMLAFFGDSTSKYLPATGHRPAKLSTELRGCQKLSFVPINGQLVTGGGGRGLG